MNILICINNRVLAEGLQRIIFDHVTGAMVDKCFSGRDGTWPDLVLFDSRERIDLLKKHYTRARFLCIDVGLKDTDLAWLLYCQGIHGIISPELDVSMFGKALRAVYEGQIWVEQIHLKAVFGEGTTFPSRGRLRGLSEQDRKIVRLVAGGRKNREIADLLCLSEPTIKAHLSRLYKILKVNNRSGLVALAAESGWTGGQES